MASDIAVVFIFLLAILIVVYKAKRADDKEAERLLTLEKMEEEDDEK